ncbi:uncharacterized protein ACA1_076190 [Acanthamoeba castellanii str. Neff]|uniref:Uncharacterized protein n=1 Tax=Acanthamoeba castellanii (strain ATCC 30010 / Neff) TaxID=1257118 RepID=L8GNG8_ACACF|nr:uncharacterized protein ACA1_076190 [Acanthamoeba castellanii str. Neff]ELR13776.1 hypothetical protein ACA1_076190 [Acanthamoeba castellanii str. Neff]
MSDRRTARDSREPERTRTVDHLPTDDPFSLCRKIVKTMKHQHPEIADDRKARMSVCATFSEHGDGLRCNYFMRNYGADVKEMIDEGESARTICNSLDFNKRPPKAKNNSSPEEKAKTMRK